MTFGSLKQRSPAVGERTGVPPRGNPPNDLRVTETRPSPAALQLQVQGGNPPNDLRVTETTSKRPGSDLPSLGVEIPLMTFGSLKPRSSRVYSVSPIPSSGNPPNDLRVTETLAGGAAAVGFDCTALC